MEFKLTILLICLPLAILFGQLKPIRNLPYKVEYYCPPCGCTHDDKVFEGAGVCDSCNMAYNSRIMGLEDKPAEPVPTPIVGILLFDGADIMDVTGPMSVFEHAGFRMLTVAKDKNPKQIGRFVQFAPDYDFDSLPKVDVLVVPGGGPAEANQDMDIVAWIRQKNKETDTMFSVCSGAFFLAHAGILDQNEATTFASLIPQLRDGFPNVTVLNDVKYTNNGHVITSSGLSSGIDASFEVVAKYLGVGRAQDIANHMEYPWKRRNDYARSQLADNYILSLNNLIRPFAAKYTFSEGNHDRWEYQFLLWTGVDSKAFLTFIYTQLTKMESFNTGHLDSNSITAEIRHKDLGKGHISLLLTNTTEGPLLKVIARRSSSFNISKTN
ncbi:DJ-1/PfpI family protein [Flagellimonas flava]|uniref:DJ-1/PfpI family protein n=1 Tax=Flagellimonas flava TaxID=570519 RepID=A0A1M5JZE5_9FLAO|nr:DJ-1/PfpI family protein [Allomuricauda flava]SHG45619.1 DJ-1/PfpI family protein [Allomuricauda flava]